MDYFFFPLFLFLFQIHFSKSLADPRTDLAALLSFRAGVVDPGNALSGWSESDNSSSHCSWIGVACSDNETRVTSLQLISLGLSGTIPPVLSNISSLQLLDLSNNSFRGHIPSEFSRLSSIRSLRLSQNFLTGSVPLTLSQNLNLQEIFLDSNQLTSTIPEKLGVLRKLRILELSKNNISGAIPSSLSNLSALTHFSIGQNQLRGEIPAEIGNLRRLLSIELSSNNLTGEIPSSIYNISSLVSLSLASNNLTGTLRTDIGISLPNLRELNLGGNGFHGRLPNSVSNLTEIESLDVSWNGFSGSIPLFGKATKLRFLNLGRNFFSSDTEQNLHLFDSLTNSTQLENLQLVHNELSGELPVSVGNLSRSLQEFCVDENSLIGQVPGGIGRLTGLISLALERNFLGGEIPRNIGSLTRLQKLSIQQNQFSGEIPDIFGELSELSYLMMGYNRFSGKIPPSIGACQRLSSLDLTGNKLEGSIPMKIFRLSNLNYLAMAKNSLSGRIPNEVKNLRQVLAIELSDNRLTGNIPASLGDCSSLNFLAMARNNLTGPIPDSLGSLASLETLDLSLNNLSGIIPKDLAKLRDLKNLNLSFNRLEGEILVGGVFENATAASLQGNKLLCSSNLETSRRFGLMSCVTKKENKHLKLKIIVPAMAALGVLICIVLFVVLAFRARKKRKEIGVSPPVKGFPPMISYNDIRTATGNFAAENLIGQGGSGSVYKGLLISGNEDGGREILAVKVLNLRQKKASKSFERECAALRNTRHRNLVKVITSCSSVDKNGDEFKALVMEFMPNGSLDQWLYPVDLESFCPVLTLSQRLNILVDVASAMDYLHNDCDPPFVHRDLKPGNVLLDEAMTAHVGDFGLARCLDQNQSQESNTIGLRGSIGYIAPEYGFGGKASTSGDVYSFGILVLETFIARKPTDETFKEGLSMNRFASAADTNGVAEIVDRRLFTSSNENSGPITGIDITSPSYFSGSSNSSSGESEQRRTSEECVAAAIRVGLGCAAESAKERLNMREALAKLKEIKKLFLGL